MRAALIAAACVAATGCVRDATDQVCPDLAKGDLIVTEIGGPQTGNDLLVPWIEIYNASGDSVDLRGTRIRFRRLDGSAEISVLVRRSLVTAAESYTVLGLDKDSMLESYLDYSFGPDYQGSWLSAAAIDVEVCGTLVNRARYSSLPNTGSYSLGTMPPDPDATEDATKWCTDTTANGAGFPGSPQRANIACPP
ncbi:MAG TPA: hypothetical protein VM513_02575 [Kofleriaceae bacterium]|nr:hypothetical protein [Kofleriaceae bacterium]